MATLGNTVLTLTDWAKRLDPDGKTADIVELLSETNEILADQLYMEGNLPTGHRTTVRTSLPTVAFRKLNEGVTPSKSTTAQVDDQASILEAWSEVDVDEAILNGNTFTYRLSEASAFLEAMSQTQTDTLIYGNGGLNPEEYTGLAVRYNDKSANNGQQIVDAGGTGSDNSSAWLVGWGAQTVHGIFPKGSVAGLQHDDKGKVTVQDSTGIGTARLDVYQDKFQWKSGLAIKDQRYVSRIANIDISDLTGITSAADLSELMTRATYRFPNLKRGKPVFYMNRTCMQILDILNRNDVISGGGLTFQNVDGERVMNFRGIPVKTVDALTETEAQVT
jgi:hypothetical protein